MAIISAMGDVDEEEYLGRMAARAARHPATRPPQRAIDAAMQALRDTGSCLYGTPIWEESWQAISIEIRGRYHQTRTVKLIYDKVRIDVDGWFVMGWTPDQSSNSAFAGAPDGGVVRHALAKLQT